MDDCRRIYIKQIIIELAKKKQFLEKSENKNKNKNESEVKQSGVYRPSSMQKRLLERVKKESTPILACFPLEWSRRG